MSEPYIPPAPPSDLSAESKEIWQQIHNRLKFAEVEDELVRAGLRWRDRMTDALELLRKEGPVIKTSKNGLPKKHPAAEIARTASVQFVSIFKALGLRADELPPSPGRPQGT